MSVRLLSLVFQCNMPELKTDKGQVVPDSTSKFILLALADHANDEGEGSYPSVKKLCRKTNLSTATVCNALNALRTNGFVSLIGKSKFETNNYTILAAKIVEFQWVESSDSSGQNRGVLPTEIKPSIKPSIKPVETSNDVLPTPQQVMVGELAKVTGFDLSMHGARLGRSASKLVKGGYLPETVEINYSKNGWWYKNDWRGQKDEMPTPEQIVETIGRIEVTPKTKGHTPAPARKIILPDGQIVEANGV